MFTIQLLPAGHHQADSCRKKQLPATKNGGCSFFHQTVFVSVEVHLSCCAHVVDAAVAVAVRQVVADRVELVILLQVALILSHELQGLVHGGRGGIRYPEALCEAVLFFPTSSVHIGTSQIQIICHHVLFGYTCVKVWRISGIKACMGKNIYKGTYFD